MVSDNHTRKRSKQREKVLSIVKATKSHPTADWVFHEVRREIPHISLATVYRNLNLLVESREINEVVCDGQLRFDANKEEHFHFICRECKGIFDIDEARVESPDFKLPRGYVVEDVRMDFFGKCPSCQPKR
ncbi:MAG TPA: transcriptional repressor [Candidatus Kryptonia bacterium]